MKLRSHINQFKQYVYQGNMYTKISKHFYYIYKKNNYLKTIETVILIGIINNSLPIFHVKILKTFFLTI